MTYTTHIQDLTKLERKKLIRKCRVARVDLLNLNQCRQAYENHFGADTFPADMPYADVAWEIMGHAGFEAYKTAALKALKG